METKQAQNAPVGAGSIRTLFRVKSLDSILKGAEESGHELRRTLGPIALTLLGIGAIVGAGIFATVGTAAAGDKYRPGAGPALMISFVITAVVCGFTALCYAEFASMVPISGSAYTYSYATLGEVVAWIIGWDLIIEYAVGNIAVAISWSHYFKTLVEGVNIPGFRIFGLSIPPLNPHIPDWISTDYRSAAGVPGLFDSAPHIFGRPIVFNLLAVLIVAFITMILVWGIKESANFNGVMVGIKIVVLIFFIIIGFYWVKPANWTPFAPNGWAGISAGAAIVFFAYIGFDAVSTVAEETKNPQRNMPIGIIASLIICTILYIVVAAVFTGLISNSALQAMTPAQQAEPLTVALQQAVPNSGWAVGFVAFGSVIAHTAVLLVFQLGQPRIFFSMARDGLLPPVFYKVHPRFRTPYISTILTGVFVAFFAAIASIDEMVDLTNIGTLFAFILVCAGIVILRVKDPDRVRPFRVPSGWKWALLLYAGFGTGVILFHIGLTAKIVLLATGALVFTVSRNNIFPILGVLSCMYLIYYLPPTSWLRFAAWLNLGFVIYVGYGAVNSRLTGRQEAEDKAGHNAHTAFTGALLAVIGAGLLFFMRAFDVWNAAMKDHEALSGLPAAGAALRAVFSADPWLALSWFLAVPLAINALILCPIIVKRALKAMKAPDAQRYFNQTVVSLAIAVVLGVGSIAYLIVLVIGQYRGQPSIL
ncbi:MAG TPA: amino acid permease [Blastocatellia bacterium]|nr:amino acid permease [Blastocatellia bacterium]